MKKLLLIFGLFQCVISYAADVDNNMVWELRPDALPVGMKNGGGFNKNKTGIGTDYSQQQTFQYQITAGVVKASGTLVTDPAAAADMEGNILKVNGGSRAWIGWYEIVQPITPGVSFSISSPCTNIGESDLNGNIGGALDLNSSSQADKLFECFVASNVVYVKYATFPFIVGQSISVIRASATFNLPIDIIGYYSTRGDTPSLSGINLTAPTFNPGALAFTLGAYQNIYNICLKGTGSTLLNMGSGGVAKNVKSYNFSGTAGRSSFVNGSGLISNCDFASSVGSAIGGTGAGGTILNCYLHDSAVGFSIGSTNNLVKNCIFSGNRAAITVGGISNKIIDNTIFGFAGIRISTAITINNSGIPVMIIGNIISSYTIGIQGNSSMLPPGNGYRYDYGNNFFGLGSNTSNYVLSTQNTYLDPQFTNISSYQNLKATTAANVLYSTQIANFNNVTDFVDFVNIINVSGSAVAGAYQIQQHWSTSTVCGLVVDRSIGASTVNGQDVSFSIIYGKDFSVGANLKGIGIGGLIAGTSTYNYLDVGAAQRQEPAASSSSPGFLIQ